MDNSEYIYPKKADEKRVAIKYPSIFKYIDKNIGEMHKELRLSNLNIVGFLKMFMILELNIGLEENGVMDKNLFVTFNDVIKREIFKHNGKNLYANIIPNIKFDSFVYTTMDKYHVKKIEDNRYSDKMPITNYDTEIYAFEYMLDDYRHKLGAIDDGQGMCQLSYVNNQYLYVYDTIGKYRDIYYKTYFGENYNVMDICEKYFAGILWVYDFYFLKNNANFNNKNVSIWFYEYHRSPFLTDIANYLYMKSNTDLDIVFKKILNSHINRNVFMNPFEHYLYVTPKNAINIPDTKELIINNPEIFPDMGLIVDKIINGNCLIDDLPIDCRRISFISKCIIKNIVNLTHEEYVKYLRVLPSNNNIQIDKPFVVKYNK